ncbi:MAG: rhodanese-like domain-containing protein [Elusimicrobia bacterium]|nr:rhodanese-like domain-containing protein [Elusimicrobiota bacterium]
MNWTLTRNDPTKAKEFFEKKMTYTLGPVEVHYYQDQKVPMNIIDVRRAQDYEKGHVPGAVNLPEEKWETLKGLSQDKPNIVYCYSVVCHLAAKAAVYFAGRGYSVMEMDGGFTSWKENGLEIEKTALAQR